ncbi:MAG: hypothetical protein GC204_05895 [Chloroflexi bacterium]|nr:hypothetical protein [Chloroflexota bacterium]
MNKGRFLQLFLAFDALLLFLFVLVTVVSSQASPSPTDTPTQIPNSTPLPSVISGVVSDGNGPVAGAIVQIQGTPNTTITVDNGAFSFSGITGTTPLIVTAWSAGHYVGFSPVNPSAPDWGGGSGISIVMRQLPTKDNSKYEGFTFEGMKGAAACGLCHREYPEWKLDAHSQSATNIRFISLYTGTDVNGNAGQPTQWNYDGTILPNDPSKPDYGPGFRLDNPSRAGNCAACHTPLASTAPNNQNCAWSGCHTSLTIERANGVIPQPAIPLNLHGDAADGITCSYCHMVGDTIIDAKTNMPYPDMPGILSMKLYRPSDESQQVLFGTLIDVSRPDSYLPLLSSSQFCSSCHFGVSGGVVGMGDVKDGTVIYNSYGEWLSSPYSDPTTGKSCQDCHMPASDAKFIVFANQGGLTRNYATFHNHTMPGASDETLLKNAVTMTSSAQRSGAQLQVEVSIVNDKTGHDVPTDAPMRSLILVVEAFDANGKALTLSDGSVNPDYSGNYAGVAGKTFAKILRDNITGEMPTSAFWRAVTIDSDNRIKPLATDTSAYSFAAPNGAATVHVRLFYRRAFAQLEQQKGWNDPDILMADQTLQIAAN